MPRNKQNRLKITTFYKKEKLPLKEFLGPATYGTIALSYPKTWSAYINQTTGGGAQPVDGYFHPNFVPATSSEVAYALRMQVTSSSYAQELSQFDAAAKSGSVKINPYKLPKVPSIVGARIDGEVSSKKKGSMVLLPLRDRTIKIWTEADQYVSDFNNSILANLTFTP